jgi:transcription termination factor NusA
MAITSANQLELLQTAEAVAREKMIDPGLVVEAMEESLARAAKSRYGAEMDIRVKIDRKTGRAKFTRVRTVVADDAVENYQAEMTVQEAKQYHGRSQDRRYHVEEVPPVELGRIAAQSAKQVILQKVREAERDRQYEEFKDRAGTIINGTVKREEYGNVIVDVGRARRSCAATRKIGREAYRPGDRIRCYIKDVRREQRGPQIFLSRTAPEFMAELFKMEVPEIYEGIIEIKAVARDPGSRAKIAVISYDNSIDPVGACVGMRGSRVQAVVNELQGEKIDIIPWNEDRPTFLVNALQPAEVRRWSSTKRPSGSKSSSRRAAFARHRPARSERASGQPSDRAEHRHPDRGRGKQAPSGRIRRADQAVHGRRWIWTNSLPSFWSPKASPTSRKSPMSRTNFWSSTAWTKAPRTSFRPARATISRRKQEGAMEHARELGVEDSLVVSPA